jgi:hypothetical protein
MRIDSYARAFPAGRRIYRIDRWTIPVPGGLPLAASAWFAGLALGAVALAQLPGLHQAARAAGWPATVLVAPGALSVALTRRAVEGRTLPAHALCAQRWQLARLAPAGDSAGVARSVGFACDHTLADRVRVHGPGRVALDASLAVAEQASGVIAAVRLDVAGPAAARLVALADGRVLDVAL